MPFLEDGLYRTYTNSLAVNDVVLVPYYSDSMDGLQEALKVFEEAYPGRAIIPIEASPLIQLNGSIHCTAMTTAR
jgi:agmatine deiminase